MRSEGKQQSIQWDLSLQNNQPTIMMTITLNDDDDCDDDVDDDDHDHDDQRRSKSTDYFCCSLVKAVIAPKNIHFRYIRKYTKRRYITGVYTERNCNEMYLST